MNRDACSFSFWNGLGYFFDFLLVKYYFWKKEEVQQCQIDLSRSSFGNSLSKLKADPTDAVLFPAGSTHFLVIYFQTVSHYITRAGLQLCVDQGGLRLMEIRLRVPPRAYFSFWIGIFRRQIHFWIHWISNCASFRILLDYFLHYTGTHCLLSRDWLKCSFLVLLCFL